MTTTTMERSEMLAEVVARCRRTQDRWRDLPLRQRLGPVKTLRRLLVAECDALCAAVAGDIGKPASKALGGQRQGRVAIL